MTSHDALQSQPLQSESERGDLVVEDGALGSQRLQLEPCRSQLIGLDFTTSEGQIALGLWAGNVVLAAIYGERKR